MDLEDAPSTAGSRTTVLRSLYDGLSRGPGRPLVAAARSAVLTARGEPTRVHFEQATGGWVHRSRNGALVLPEPRGASVRGWEALNGDIFLRDYTPQPGDTVMEAGAGVGTETLSLPRMVGPTGRVISVEAHPATFAMLRRMIALNGLENVTAVHAAVTDQPGTVTISDYDVADTQANRINDGVGLTVPATTLDLLAADHGVAEVALLKSNIEGAETSALRGAGALLLMTRNAAIGCHDFLADETGDDTYRTMHEVRALLEGSGFDVKRRKDDRPWAAGYLYARRQASSPQV